VHPIDLPFENLDLTSQGQHFGLQFGFVAFAGRQHIQQQAY
jgi:hypothetical protein